MKSFTARISGAAILAGLAAFPAYSAEGSGTGVSLLGSFLQMIASLAVVIGIIFLFSHLANRWLKNGPAAGVPRYIRLVETRHLGPKKSLMLVEVGGEYFLLGNSADGMQLIKQIDMLEEIEVVGQQESMWGEGGLRSMAEKALARIRSRSGISLRQMPVPFLPPRDKEATTPAAPHIRPGLQQGITT